MNDGDLPLLCKIVNNQLIIRVGIDTLAFATNKKNGGPIDDEYKVLDSNKWAEDVIAELNNEEENGDNLITKMFDKAMVSAFENGSDALKE